MNRTLSLRFTKVLTAVCVLSSFALWGQATPAVEPRPAFEVATIKPNDGSRFLMTAPGRLQTYRAAGMARNLVAQAYKIPIKLVFGGPEWIDKDVFRIEAQIPGELFAKMAEMHGDEKGEQVSLMMQSLLADRFKLKMHVETRELPVYELQTAKDGVKLTPSDDLGPSGFNMVLPGDVKLSATNMTMAAFGKSMFGPLVDRPVIDKTGLTARYSFKMQFSPAGTLFDNMTKAPQVQESAAPILFTAIQELGLKLVPARGPVDVIVIDSMEKPSEN